MFKTLSILIPVYNEKDTVLKCLDKVLSSDTLGLEMEVIVSDNCSTDGTIELLKNFSNPKVKLLYKKKMKEKVQI